MSEKDRQSFGVCWKTIEEIYVWCFLGVVRRGHIIIFCGAPCYGGPAAAPLHAATNGRSLEGMCLVVGQLAAVRRRLQGLAVPA